MIDISKTSVLVTGATGFIGRHLTERLLKKGAFVSIISKNNVVFAGANVFCADIRDKGALDAVFCKVKPKIVFHLAAIIRAKTPEEERKMLETNVLGTKNLLLVSGKTNVARFINLSTSDVYGTSCTPCIESQSLKPRSAYGTSKMLAEELCAQYSKEHSLHITTIRPFLVYGPGQSNEMLIPYVVRSALDGKDISLLSAASVRDPIFVEDIVEYLIYAAKNQNMPEIVNAGSGKGHTVLQIAEEVLRICVSKSKLIVSENTNSTALVADTEKQKEIFGFLPKTMLNEGLKITIMNQQKE